MPTPFATRRPAQIRWTRAAKPDPAATDPDWRCTRCDKLLGRYVDTQMHLRSLRGQDYLVGFPVTATCCVCRMINVVSKPRR